MIRKLILGAVMVAAVGAATIGGSPVALAERPYKNCTEVHDDGRWDIPQGDDAYWSGGDRDGDGVACES